MPYLVPEQREALDTYIEDLTPLTGGELQYIIAKLIDNFYSKGCGGRPRYGQMEQIMGALQGATLEHYRCVVAPYEDLKIKENGGVYGRYNSGKSY